MNQAYDISDAQLAIMRSDSDDVCQCSNKVGTHDGITARCQGCGKSMELLALEARMRGISYRTLEDLSYPVQSPTF